MTALSKKLCVILLPSAYFPKRSYFVLMLVIFRQISTYLDRSDVRKQLGVDPSLTANFSSCSNDVGARFSSTLDAAFPSQLYIAALLERGVKVLLYIGANDWICNWVSYGSNFA